MDNLTCVIDHKLLLAILGNKQNLADIPNPRLMNIKLKSMMYRFKVKHIAGKDHVIPDVFSIRQDSPISLTDNNNTMSNVLPGYSDTLAPPRWVSFSRLHLSILKQEKMQAGLMNSSLELFWPP